VSSYYVPIADNKPGARRLGACMNFQTGGRIPDGEVMMILRREQSDMVARHIVECRDFFSVDIDPSGYGTMRLDAYVLTAEEYRAALKEAFDKGVRHAMYYQPMPLPEPPEVKP
jgi:hypothetical protein